MKRKIIAPYLRTLRKKSSLSQDDVAMLLGIFERTHVSRHEIGQCRPAMADYIAYEFIFGVGIGAAYENERAKIAKRVGARARSLHESLGHRVTDRLRSKKRQSLEQIIKRCSSNPPK
jgi:transcriptional regulator with XRE-family HTH domain